MEPGEIRFCRMQILWIKIRLMRMQMRICWCTINPSDADADLLVHDQSTT